LNDPTCIQAHAVAVVEDDRQEEVPKWTHFWHWYDPKKDKSLSYRHFQFGGFGALYPPQSLHPDISCADIFMRDYPLDDDIWFWIMAVRNKTKIHCLGVQNFGGWRPYCKEIDPTRSLDIGNRPRLSERRVAVDMGPLLRFYPEVKEIVRSECP
jgi:hypothetical protein